MAGKADMTAAEFVAQYGRRRRATPRAPRAVLLPRCTAQIRLELNGQEMTPAEVIQWYKDRGWWYGDDQKGGG